MSETALSTITKTTRDLLTYEDYITFPDQDGIRKEIIEGELFMTPVPSTRHQLILIKLTNILYNHIHKHDLGELLVAPCDVIFSNINVIQPDMLFISKENYQILTDLNIQGAPDIIIEILSPSTMENDRIYKKIVYEKFGVKEYWIVDPQEESVEVWTLKNLKFQLFNKAEKRQKISSHLLKDLEIDLSLIF